MAEKKYWETMPIQYKAGMYLVENGTDRIYHVIQESEHVEDAIQVLSLFTKELMWADRQNFRPFPIQIGEDFEYKKGSYRRLGQIYFDSQFEDYRVLAYEHGPGYGQNVEMMLSHFMKHLIDFVKE